LFLHFLPRPWVTVEGLRVANEAEGSEPELLRVAKLEMRVALLPLFAGHIEVQSLRLQRPVLLLERLGDGQLNWAAMAGGRLLQPHGRADAISLAAVEVHDGELVWRDHVAGREQRLSGIDAQISAERLQGPLLAQGRLRYQAQPVNFNLDLGSSDQRGRQRLRLSLDLPEAAGAEVQLSGFLLGEQKRSRFEGRAALHASEARALLQVVGGAQVPARTAAWPVAAEAEVSWEGEELSLSDLEVRLDAAHLVGSARLRPRAAEAFELHLAARFLELDRLLPVGVPQWPSLTLPPQLAGRIDLRIERLRWRGRSAEEVNFSARLERGALEVERAAAALPGGALLLAEGRWDLSPRSPGFLGRLNFESANLRTQLRWLGLEPSATAADRLRRLSLAGDISISPATLRFSDFRLELDRMEMAGGLVLALRERPGLGLRLALEQADLGAYAGVWKEVKSSFLTSFDANLELQAARLSLAGRQARGVEVSATLQEGQLHVRDLRIADLGGAEIAVSGRFSQFDDKLPSLENGHVSLNVPDSRQFFDEIELAVPPLLQSAGALEVEGSVGLEGGDASLRLNLALLDGTGALQVDWLADAAGRATVEGHLELQDFAFSQWEGFPLAAQLGEARGRLISSFHGDEERLRHQARLTFDEAALELEGAVTAPWSSAPAWQGQLTFQHPEAAWVSQLLFARENILSGALTLQARAAVSRERLLVDRLEGRAGDLRFSGEVKHDRLPREELLVKLSFGRWELAPAVAFLATFSPVADWFNKEGRWSRTPLRLDGLRGPNLDLQLQVAHLDLGHAELEDLEVIARRDTQTWVLEHFEAAAGGGRVAAEGRGAMGNLDRLGLEVALQAEAVPLSYLEPWLPHRGITSGSLTASITASTAGASPGELVSGLTGSGQLEGSLRLMKQTVGEEAPPAAPNAAPLPWLFAEMEAPELRVSGEVTAEAGRITTSGLQLQGSARRLEVSGLLASLPLRRGDLEIQLYDRTGDKPLKVLHASGPLTALELRRRPLPSTSSGPVADAPLIPLSATSGATARPHGP
ncbi:MAG TPA: AsmA family protein, partial [Kiloniellales bacterium]|nr:AsmA family protein [Kiloniellales bacterium]